MAAPPLPVLFAGEARRAERLTFPLAGELAGKPEGGAIECLSPEIFRVATGWV